MGRFEDVRTKRKAAQEILQRVANLDTGPYDGDSPANKPFTRLGPMARTVKTTASFLEKRGDLEPVLVNLKNISSNGSALLDQHGTITRLVAAAPPDGATVEATTDAWLTAAEGFLSAASPALSLAIVTSAAGGGIFDAFNELLARQTERSDEMIHKMKATVSTVQELAQSAGITRHAGIFVAQATAHQRKALWWLVATIALLVATIGLALGNYYLSAYHPVPLDTSALVQVTVSKAVVFSVLFSSLFLATRSYRMHQHNFVVNSHRANALSSFESFVSSSDDKQTRDAVLLQSTQAIFAPQPTGVGEAGGDHAALPPILEIIRDSSKSK